MLVPAVVFVLVVGLVLGIYAAVTQVPEMLAAHRLNRRLRDVGPLEADAELTVVKQSAKGPLPGFDRLMSRGRAGSWTSRLIERSGVKTTPSAMAVIVLVAAAGAALIAMFVVPWTYAPLVAALVGTLAPIVWLVHRGNARLKRFEEQFPEALDLLSRAIRAGHAFQTALGMVADDLTAPVGPEFKKAFEQQNFGLPLRDVLIELSERVPLLDVRFFVTAVLIQRDTGGNLSEILDNLAHVVRERFKIQRQVRVHTAHGRFTGWVLMGLPAALSVALSFINPEHMHLLFHERMGQTMLIGAIVLQTIGYIWIRRVIKIEV
jgi:tight adherence protein B